MNFSGILIGSEYPQRLADYYTKLFGTPVWDDGGYVGWLIVRAGSPLGRTTRFTARMPSRAG